ncbi:hypothetical protein SBADM41S_11194 [Streptomyces badius]
MCAMRQHTTFVFTYGIRPPAAMSAVELLTSNVPGAPRQQARGVLRIRARSPRWPPIIRSHHDDSIGIGTTDTTTATGARTDEAAVLIGGARERIDALDDRIIGLSRNGWPSRR